ncbi:MAG: class I SAM-dependent methyltransferase [Thermoplasmata archaeon]|nr:class I SAM-dependent methyltransferase [Thermoplasmata archaeon]
MTAAAGPDATAVRVALWRAMHVQVDPPPHVLDDIVGLELVAPSDDWRSRPDMDPEWTKGFRAAIVARARFIEDLVVEQAADGVAQYVLLGAGLDTFAQRRTDLAGRIRVFEIDRPGSQAWKRQRLIDLGYGVAPWLRFVPVDFEATDDWYARLAQAGFDTAQPAVIASTGVSMYLTKEANRQVLDRVARFTTSSTLVMTFMVRPELLGEADRAGLQAAASGAQASGTPFISFYTPDEILAVAFDVGFPTMLHVPGSSMEERYFANRTDGLKPSSGEDLLIAST